jgi:hypothetical protein
MRYLTLVSLPFLLLACTSTSSSDDPTVFGRAQAVINQVPASVGCVQVTAVGSTVKIVGVDTTPGQTVSVQLAKLPVGSVTFSALAFQSGCAAVNASSIAEWASDPVAANVAAGQVTAVSLLLKATGNASVGISFDDGSSNPSPTPTPTPSPGCTPSKALCTQYGQVCGTVPDGCGGLISCGPCAAGACCGDYCAGKPGLCM